MLANDIVFLQKMREDCYTGWRQTPSQLGEEVRQGGSWMGQSAILSA